MISWPFAGGARAERTKAEKVDYSTTRARRTRCRAGLSGFLRGNRAQGARKPTLPGCYPIVTRFHPILRQASRCSSSRNRDHSGQPWHATSSYPGPITSLSPMPPPFSAPYTPWSMSELASAGRQQCVPGWCREACYPARVHLPTTPPRVHHRTRSCTTSDTSGQSVLQQ